jgi:hypothetical protein
MAELYLSAIKSAGMIPIAGWAARFYGRSAHGLWTLDFPDLFICNYLNSSDLRISDTLETHHSQPKKRTKYCEF